MSLLKYLLVCLDLISVLKIIEPFHAYAAFGVLAHLLDVLFHMLERVDFAYAMKNVNGAP
jgi:hypothetical protein